MTTPTCHPDRKHRARGLCGSCYVMAQRKGFDDDRSLTYQDDLIEELDFLPMTWPEAEKAFNRDRGTLSKVLVRAGREDLIRDLQRRTYGAVGQDAIISLVNGGKK